MTSLYWARYLFLIGLVLVVICFFGALVVSLVRSRGK